MLDSLSRGFNAALRHPWLSGGGLVGFSLFLDVAGRFQVGASLVSWYYGPDWTVAQIYASATFKTACLAFVVFALWRIGRSAIQEEQRRGLTQEEEASRRKGWEEAEAKRLEVSLAENIKAQEQFSVKIRSAVMDALQIPIDMGKISLFIRELSILGTYIEHLRRAVDQYERETAKWLASEAFQISLGETPPLYDPNMGWMPFYSFQLPADDGGQWRSVTIIPTSDNAGSMRTIHTYDPAINASARDDIRINIALLKRRLVQVENLAAAGNAQLQQMHDSLDERVKQSG